MKQNILLDYQIDIIPFYIASSSVAMHLKDEMDGINGATSFAAGDKVDNEMKDEISEMR